MCLLRCVLLLLTYFQDERHPYRVRLSKRLIRYLTAKIGGSLTQLQVCGVCVCVKTEYSNCVNKLEKDLVSSYQSQFENLFNAEAPTWETHGNLMVKLFHKIFHVRTTRSSVILCFCLVIGRHKVGYNCVIKEKWFTIFLRFKSIILLFFLCFFFFISFFPHPST